MAPDGQSSRSIKELLDQLEEGIEGLRVAYEKYFGGVERKAPADMHRRVERMLRNAEAERSRKTAVRFRLNGLRARFVTYKHYWTRILGQIEAGTYRRHLQRVARQQRGREAIAAQSRAGTEAAPATAEATEPDVDDFDAAFEAAVDRTSDGGTAPAGRAAPPPPPAPGSTPGGAKGGAKPPPPPPPVPGMNARSTRALYDKLVQAKRAAGEDLRGLTYRGLCTRLAKEAAKLEKRHGSVRFEVASDGGKVRLRAKPTG